MPIINKNGQKIWMGPSNSDNYMANKSPIPQINSNISKEVSTYRNEEIALEVKSGLYREGSETTDNNYQRTKIGNVVAHVGTVKHAQVVSGGVAGGGFRGSGDTVRQGPEVYSPLWLNSNLSLPRDRATINAWCRAFYALNPFVHNAINLHSTYPISKLNIKCPNKEIERFFNDMIEETDLMNICVQIAQEYWLLGEAFVYAELDESVGKWSRFLIQNPDYMVIRSTVVASEPNISIRPDPNLIKVINSNKPSDIEQKKQMPQYIIDSVKRGQNIPLDNLQVSHLARRISPYETRGTGLPVCIFRQLMLFDQLRESKFVQASSMITPTTIVKIGSADFKPTFADLEAYRELFEAAEHDKNFKIFTHDGVNVERIGWGQGIYDISGDITQLVKEIYVGLQVPPVLMDGQDITYNNGGVALDALRQRYMQFRNMMSTWLKRKVFAPISKMQGFYDYSGGEKKLIVPDVDWNHMSLFDASDYIQVLLNLTQGATADQKRASLHTLYRSLGLEYEDEVRKIRKEAIQNAIFMREKQALDKMDLHTLRSLDDQDEIPEPTEAESEVKEAPLPGESAGPSAPEGMPSLPGGSGPPGPPV